MGNEFGKIVEEIAPKFELRRDIEASPLVGTVYRDTRSVLWGMIDIRIRSQVGGCENLRGKIRGYVAACNTARMHHPHCREQ